MAAALVEAAPAPWPLDQGPWVGAIGGPDFLAPWAVAPTVAGACSEAEPADGKESADAALALSAWQACGVDDGALWKYVERYEAIASQVAEVTDDLKVILKRSQDLEARRSRLQPARAQVVEENFCLQDRLERLRRALRQLKSLPPEDIVHEQPPVDAKSFAQGAAVLQRLPSMLRRAAQFDQDEDGLGDAPLEELEKEAAILLSYRDEARAALSLETEQMTALEQMWVSAVEERRHLNCRIAHLRTCILKVKRKESEQVEQVEQVEKAADHGEPPSAKTPVKEGDSSKAAGLSLKILRRGGC